MRAFARRLGWRLAPEMMADRAVDWNRRVRQQHGRVDAARNYTARHGTTVAAGPFAGLRYPEGRESDIDALAEKLAGIYERDLHPLVAEAVERSPTTFVDLGTADGYYAVGFARLTGVETHGFEPSSQARGLCSALARENGVELTLHGAATSRRLRSLPLEDAFVLSDCEGAEARIFDPQAVAALQTAFVVIELHEKAAPGVTSTLTDRFAGTHEVEVIHLSAAEPLRSDGVTWMVLRPRRQEGTRDR